MQPSSAWDPPAAGGAFTGDEFFSDAQLERLFTGDDEQPIAMNYFEGVGQELPNPFKDEPQPNALLGPLSASLPLSQQQQHLFQFDLTGFPPVALEQGYVQQDISSHSFSTSSGGDVANQGHRRSSKPRPKSSQSELSQPQEPQKNAQKRFRERQKAQMQMLEQMLAMKQAEFVRLSEANVALKTRTSLLEKVVACRDEQLYLLQRFKQAVTDVPFTPGAGCFSPYLPAENELTPGIPLSGCFPTAPPVNQLGEPQPLPQLTEEEVSKYKNITGDELIKWWKGFVTQVSSHLLASELQSSNQQALLQYVTKVVNQTGSFMKHVVLLNEGAMGKLLMANLETGKPGNPPGPEHWAATIRLLQLSPQQVHDVLSVYSLYRGLLAKVHEERNAICGAVGGAIEAANSSCSSGAAGMAALMRSVESERGLGVRSVEDLELLDRLQANLAKERSAQLMLCCFLFGKVLSPVEFARAAVHSYPFFPDSLALCHQMAESAAAATAGTGAVVGTAAAGAAGAQQQHQQQLQLLQHFPVPVPKQL